MNSCLSQSINELWFQKMVGSQVFLSNLCINLFILMSGMNLWRLIIKRKEIIMWICVYPNWKMNFNSKNGGKRSFSYETKASISFIPMKRTNLWCPIIGRKEIITWIRVYPNCRQTLIPKNGGMWGFSYETKGLIHLS